MKSLDFHWFSLDVLRFPQIFCILSRFIPTQNYHRDFPETAELIAVHNDNDFGVDIGYDLLSELDPQGFPAFFVGTEDMGYTGYSTISNALLA